MALGNAWAEGAMHRVLRLEDGRAWGWGANAWGQLDPGLPAAVAQPVEVPAAAGAAQVATGLRHTLAVAADGVVWAWGDNTSGQLGAPATQAVPGKVQVPLPKSAQAIAAGAQHSVALLADGTVWAWGANQRGQLGRPDAGAFALSRPPGPVSALPSSVLSVAAGADFSVALLATGNVWVWGGGSFWPVQLALPAPATSVKAWARTAIVRDRSGKYWRWAPPSAQLAEASEADFEALEALRTPTLQITGHVAPGTTGRASVSGPGNCSAVRRDGRFTCRVPFGWSGVMAFRPAAGGVDRRQVPLVTTTADVDFTAAPEAAAERVDSRAAPAPASR